MKIISFPMLDYNATNTKMKYKLIQVYNLKHYNIKYKNLRYYCKIKDEKHFFLEVIKDPFNFILEFDSNEEE